MTPANALEPFLAGRIAAGDFPGCAWTVARGERTLAQGALGRAMVEPREIAAAPETIWDLASLTKCFATAPLAARLAAAGLIALDAPLTRVWPDLPGDKRPLTLELLLTHASGLPAWAPAYLCIPGKRELYEWLCGIPLERPPGTKLVYSDLGYLLAGLTIEKLGGAPLEDLFYQQFARPLHLRDTGFNPPVTARRRIAASEPGNAHEEGLIAGNPRWAARPPLRQPAAELRWGVVHDGNARFLGGAAGHAGLFGTVSELHRLAVALVGGELREVFIARRADDGETVRSLACVLSATKGSAGNGVLPGNSPGHAGFTGVSWHYEPDRDRHYFLLTNRTHPRPSPADPAGWRREFLRLAAALPD